MQIAIGLYPGFTALDAIGPYAVFTSVPGAEVVVCAEQKGLLADESDLLHLDLAHTFDEVPAPDVLLVPGGLVTRRVAAEGGPIVDWIRAAHETTTYTTSVCTGAPSKAPPEIRDLVAAVMNEAEERLAASR